MQREGEIGVQGNGTRVERVRRVHVTAPVQLLSSQKGLERGERRGA